MLNRLHRGRKNNELEEIRKENESKNDTQKEELQEE
jgi:hypothetical protein